ncbi:hypothetical protein V6N11_030983 [Hibiscus sabdariffa]|uniref:Uncharacterized protein n=1 Tax=Hibiscus sabdariffa TaxID=183260 RepID=A0ABR2NRY9_9ROSI
MMVPSGSSSSGSAPHEHEPGAPEPEQPLLSDEIRLQELGDRLRINFLGKAMSLGEQEDFVETQLLIEKKKIDQALFSDATGFHFHGFRALYQSFFSRYAAPRARSSRDKRSENKAGGIPRWGKSFNCVLNIAMAIYLSLRVAPLDLQQGGNSRIPYVHVPAARMVWINSACFTVWLSNFISCLESLVIGRYKNLENHPNQLQKLKKGKQKKFPLLNQFQGKRNPQKLVKVAVAHSERLRWVVQSCISCSGLGLRLGLEAVASGYASTIDESANSDALSNPVLTDESHSVYMDLAIASF